MIWTYEHEENPLSTATLSRPDRGILRASVRGVYDLQKQRMATGIRVVQNFKAKLGYEPGKREDDQLDADAKKILQSLRNCYDRITDGARSFGHILKTADFSGQELISNEAELVLLRTYYVLEEQERELFRMIGLLLRNYPIWSEYLVDVKGIGPAMGGVIISEIDISVNERRGGKTYASSLWKYAGLDTGPDGRGRGRYAEHLVDKEYVDRHGEIKARRSITFNPFLKTKLLGVAAGSFLKIADSPYRQLYLDVKHRYEHHAVYGVHNDKTKDENGRLVTSKGRRHNMAMRYMIKMFLAHLYSAWRRIEGLPDHGSYAETKLDLRH